MQTVAYPRAAPWIALALLEALAQVSLKFAASAVSPDADGWAPVGGLIREPWFAASIGCDVAGFWAWMVLLAKYELSVAIPVSALSYFATIAASTFILHESVTWQHAAGLLCIGAGIALVAGND